MAQRSDQCVVDFFLFFFWGGGVTFMFNMFILQSLAGVLSEHRHHMLLRFFM